MTQLHDNIVGIDAAIFMHPLTWKASGHIDNFNDPMIDNKDSQKTLQGGSSDRRTCGKAHGRRKEDEGGQL